jgi:LemA protein
MNHSQRTFGLVLAALVSLASSGCGYNYVIGLNEATNSAWAEVDNELKRRNDIVPELVNTVKGAGIQEQTVYLGIANARKAYFESQSVPQKQAAAQQMDSALSRLLFLQEQYPELKSNENFLKLQDTLEGTENRLSTTRKRYNDSVKELNTYVGQLPGRFWAMLAGVEKRTYYEIKVGEREAPTVDFSGLGGEANKAGGEKPPAEKPAEDKPADEKPTGEKP